MSIRQAGFQRCRIKNHFYSGNFCAQMGEAAETDVVALRKNCLYQGLAFRGVLKKLTGGDGHNQ